MEWDPGLAYVYVMLIYTDIPRVLMIDTPCESATARHYCVCPLWSEHPPTPTEVRCTAWLNATAFLHTVWLLGSMTALCLGAFSTPSLTLTTRRSLPGSEPATIRDTVTYLANNFNECLSGLDLSNSCFSGGKTFLTWFQPLERTSLPYWLYKLNGPLFNLKKGWDLNLRRYCKSPKTAARSPDCSVLQGRSHAAQLFSKLSMQRWPETISGRSI